MPNTTSAQGSGTRGSRRSRGSRSGLVGIVSVLDRSRRMPAVRFGAEPDGGWVFRGWCGSGLVLELLLDRARELVPRVDELLHGLLLQHPEDVVEVHTGVGHGLHDLLRVGVGLLDRGRGLAVVGVG